MRSLAPVLTMIVALIAIWYGAAIALNSAWALDKAKRADVTLTTSALIADTWSQEKPRLPAPHQVGQEIWKTTVEKKITSKRSLIYHSWITLQATLLGFGLGTVRSITPLYTIPTASPKPSTVPRPKPSKVACSVIQLW